MCALPPQQTWPGFAISCFKCADPSRKFMKRRAHPARRCEVIDGVEPLFAVLDKALAEYCCSINAGTPPLRAQH